MPHWPCFLNLRGLPSRRAPSFWMKAKRTFFGHRLGQLLAVQLVELRLGIEQVDLAGRAFEVDADAALRLGSEVRRPGRQRDRGPPAAVSAASRPSSRSSDARASRPMPLAEVVRN